MSAPIAFPPFLQQGDRVTVISTSGALREFDALEKGMDVWRSRGYRVELGFHWDQKEGYLAGTDEQRRQALLEAWKNPDCKAILCTRGGYGSARLLEQWQWPLKSVTPKWLIGFSDITGLLWSLATVGIAGIHGPVLTTLAEEPNWSQQRLFDALEGRALKPLMGDGWGGGVVSGKLLPANLTVATHLLESPAAHLTRLGPWLRKTSVDELPQLWSIIKGDMSFVGPRPALFNQHDLIDLRQERGIDRLIPGLTGWAQVNGRDELPLLQKVELELYYLKHQSLAFDAKILWITLIKVLRRDSVSH